MICQRCNKTFDRLDTRFLFARQSMDGIYIVCPECKGEFLEALAASVTDLCRNSMPMGEVARIGRERAEMYARSEVC